MKVLGAFARAVVGRLELLGALEREQAAKEEEAQRSQELQQTLDSLSAHIAILDESGEIIAVNEMWGAFAEANGGDPGKVAEGANYLRVCESATGSHAEEAASFAEGIRDVLAGRRANFEMEYPCHSPMQRRWFVGRVTPDFCNEKAWAVVAHENTTERKLAEEALGGSEGPTGDDPGASGRRYRSLRRQGEVHVRQHRREAPGPAESPRHHIGHQPGGVGVAHYPDGHRLPLEEWPISRALGGETTVGREVRMTRPDGSHYDVLISAAPLNNADGELVGAVAGLLDITEQNGRRRSGIVCANGR